MATVKTNIRGINQVMRSDGVQAVVLQAARRIRDRAGADLFEVAGRPHRWTARAYVQPISVEGARAEARDKVLTRAVG